MLALKSMTAVLSAAAYFGIVLASPAGKPSVNASARFDPRQAGTSFWYANIDHTSANVRGYAPDLDGDYVYEVYRAVSPGDGASIQAAINSATNGNTRHGKWFASQPRVVYIPPGEYLISKTIYMNTDTIIIGDANTPPVLKAAPGFPSDGTLFSGQDPATGISGELSFAVALKNLVLDTTNVAGNAPFVALYWGVAQAAHLQNVKIRMPYSVNGAGHTGIRLGRGSTLAVSDVRIERGQNGIWYNGHQQAVFKSIYFFQNTVGMLIDGGHTISIINPTFDTVGTGVLNTGGYPWIGLIDAKSINSGVTFKTTTWPNYLIENLSKDTTSDVAQGPGTFILPGQSHIAQFTYANTVNSNPIYQPLTSSFLSRPPALAPGGRYPVPPAPSYASLPVTSFLNIKDPGQNGGRRVLGDNTVDESATLNAILRLAADQNKIAYFPFGKYRVDSTLLIPAGSRIVGEAWATIVGYGSFFKDEKNPKPVVQVGLPGEVGVAQIQDMRFTVGDVLPGAIILQFHLAGANPGDVAIWNSLVTVGGTRGAKPLTDACRDPANQCKAAFMGMHLARTSSVYVENVWNWVADHVVEVPLDGGSSFAAGRGVLVEATKGTWLHGLGSEHWWLYQLNFRKAENVLVSLLQSETNYDQGDNNLMVLPAPWTVDEAGWGDPTFSWCGQGDKRCRMGPANYFNGGNGIRTYASASWAFFSGPGYQQCSGDCQRHMHFVKETPANLQAFGLCSKDAYATLRLADGTEVVTANGFTGSWEGDVGRYTP
ncbi:glycoside hydrolase family 55 protein [Parathielavia appendiculata]|uniref:Glycoside hydrolase family 55 protein n=1 Tax=Parathielavia appendiculata TaxID=2587402 RepID=A0AAN6TS30_9PEZI|nr:glycoside hydrolase family 55 protein [Parathielavia appendiculata]